MARTYNDILAGTRVVELCWAWAGPLAARTLGDLGAEVIKVEGPSRPDAVRFGNYPDDDPGDEPWNRGGHFQKHSRNKKGLVLDISEPRGRDVFLNLIARSDIFIESNAPRVLGNLGITYEELRAVKPDLIMVSMPGFGNTGPLRDWVAFGLNLEAYCGLSSVTGYADTGPVRSVVPYGDPIAGLHTVVAVLAALRARRRNGTGQYIEVAQNESLLNVLVEPFFRRTVGGEDVHGDGCHHEHIAPHNVYTTRGEDEWVAIVAADEASFGALGDLVGHPQWREDSGLADPYTRKAREAELDTAISTWAAAETRESAIAKLQAAGVPATAVQRVDEIVHDERLRRRGYWREVDHPVTGQLTYSFLPWSYWRTDPAEMRPAPVFGEHNDTVLREILGMGDEEIEALYESGVVTSRPNMA